MLSRAGVEASMIATRLGQRQTQVRSIQITTMALDNKGFVESAKEKAEDLAHRAKSGAENLKDKAKDAAETTKEKAYKFKEKVVGDDATSRMKDEAENIQENVRDKAQDAKDAAKRYTHDLGKKMEEEGQRLRP